MTILSITEANRTGISGIVASAEAGTPTTLSRHGRAVADVVSHQELRELRRDRDTLRDATLVMVRMAADSGTRTDLDQAMAVFGIDRAELEAEIETGLHTL